MAWFKVDDGFWSHPKVMTMSPGATSLWVRAGSYSCQHLTDGFIADGLLPVLGSGEAAGELVESGLWSRVPGGFQFHDWSEYQESSEDVKRRREAARDRKRRQRRAQSGKYEASRRESRGGHAVSHADVTRDSPRDMPEPEPEPEREDVEALCERLRDAVAARVTRPVRITKAWRDAARLLLDRDEVPFDDAVRVLDWSQRDEFWSTNVLSMPTFRKQYSRLELQERGARQAGTGPAVGRGSSAPSWFDLQPEEPGFDVVDGEVVDGHVVQLRSLG